MESPGHRQSLWRTRRQFSNPLSRHPRPRGGDRDRCGQRQPARPAFPPWGGRDCPLRRIGRCRHRRTATTRPAALRTRRGHCGIRTVERRRISLPRPRRRHRLRHGSVRDGQPSPQHVPRMRTRTSIDREPGRPVHHGADHHSRTGTPPADAVGRFESPHAVGCDRGSTHHGNDTPRCWSCWGRCWGWWVWGRCWGCWGCCWGWGCWGCCWGWWGWCRTVWGGGRHRPTLDVDGGALSGPEICARHAQSDVGASAQIDGRRRRRGRARDVGGRCCVGDEGIGWRRADRGRSRVELRATANQRERSRGAIARARAAVHRASDHNDLDCCIDVDHVVDGAGNRTRRNAGNHHRNTGRNRSPTAADVHQAIHADLDGGLVTCHHHSRDGTALRHHDNSHPAP